MKTRKARKCKKCGKKYTLGVNGMVWGCDECLHVIRDEEGTVTNDDQDWDVWMKPDK